VTLTDLSRATTVLIALGTCSYAIVAVIHYLKLIRNAANFGVRERLRLGLSMNLATIYLTCYVAFGRYHALTHNDPFGFRDVGSGGAILVLVLVEWFGTKAGRRWRDIQGEGDD
jgi:hypothetical protein